MNTTHNDKKNAQWLQLTIVCDPRLTESISDYLVGVFAAGVEIGVEDRLIQQTVHAYLQPADFSEQGVMATLAALAEHFQALAEIFHAQCPIVSSEILVDADWNSLWKSHFKPFAIVPGLIIKPSWEEYRATADEQVIEMDPGMAFGTGHHATTSLCMGLIRKSLHIPSNPKVLDVGTGTGILAMAAALWGAAEVLAIDNDRDALAAAEENVNQNNLQQKVKISALPLGELAKEFDLVVANIIYDTLQSMAEQLAQMTAPTGSLILSGILRDGQADNIAATYTNLGFRLQERKESGEWAALRLVKNTDQGQQ